MSGSNSTSVKRNLTLFGFFAMTASMVMAVYEYPSFGTSGCACIFFALLGGIFWFLPMAFMAAEMASVDGWSTGGVFGWVGNALHSDRLGFMALFFQWFQITVGYVTMCYVIIGLLSQIFNWQALNDTAWIKFIAVLIIFGVVTLLQLGGTKYTTIIAKIGFIVGILVSAIILFIFAIIYLAQGHPVQIKFGASEFFPSFANVGNLTIFATFILAYTGVEASGSHIDELQKPERNYPAAMFILVVIAIVFDSLGGIAVASAIPEENLSLNSGLFQTLQYLMYKVTGSYILDWLLDIVCILVCFGIVAEIGSWIVGPSAGLRDSAQYGMMPMGIKRVNKHNVPTNVLIINCILVLCWDALLTFGGSSGAGNVSILVAETLTTCIYLVTYLFMCASYYTLIFKWKKLHRTYNVPGGIVVKTIVAICGTVTSLFALVVSFFPSSALTPSGQVEYEVLLVIAFIIAIIIPIVISAFHKSYVAKIDPSQLKYLTYKMVKMKKAQAQTENANTDVNANMNA